jgi:hypothetical protein
MNGNRAIISRPNEPAYLCMREIRGYCEGSECCGKELIESYGKLKSIEGEERYVCGSHVTWTRSPHLRSHSALLPSKQKPIDSRTYCSHALVMSKATRDTLNFPESDRAFLEPQLPPWDDSTPRPDSPSRLSHSQRHSILHWPWPLAPGPHYQDLSQKR